MFWAESLSSLLRLGVLYVWMGSLLYYGISSIRKEVGA